MMHDLLPGPFENSKSRFFVAMTKKENTSDYLRLPWELQTYSKWLVFVREEDLACPKPLFAVVVNWRIFGINSLVFIKILQDHSSESVDRRTALEIVPSLSQDEKRNILKYFKDKKQCCTFRVKSLRRSGRSHSTVSMRTFRRYNREIKTFRRYNREN